MPESVKMNSEYTVSSRGRRTASEDATNLFFDVLNNPWYPDTNPNGLVNIGIAENSLMHDTLLDYINKKIELPARYLTYNHGSAGSTRLKSAVCLFLNRQFAPVVDLQPDHLVVTNGVSAAIEHLAFALTDPGEGILLGRPYYGTFIPDLSSRTAAEVIGVSFGDCDPFAVAAVDKYEQALLEFQQRTGKRVTMLVLCNPHNPLGRCYPREAILQLMRLCQKYRMHLVSDEIYALSTWKNTVDVEPVSVAFESVLSIDKTGVIDEKLVHALWGMSKDFGANGIRVGAIVSQANRELHAAIRGPTLYSYASGLSDHIAANILEDDDFTDKYIQKNNEKLAASYKSTVRKLRNRDIEYAPGCNAAFFLWVNLGKKFLETHPGARQDGDLTKEIQSRLLGEKVFLASGISFGSERAGWFRIVFSHPEDYLEEAFRRIDAAMV